MNTVGIGYLSEYIYDQTKKGRVRNTRGLKECGVNTKVSDQCARGTLK